MRVFLQNPAGQERMDFNGWNRAYRQFFANTSLSTGSPVDVPLGTAPPAPPMVVNPARPSRFALAVENLPVAGWPVEVEVDAARWDTRRVGKECVRACRYRRWRFN